MSTRALALVLTLVLALPPIAAGVAPLLSVASILPPDEGGVEVTIVRDAFGVAHIYADDAYALFWGNGYVQAEDRLFQLDVLRHVGKGESARILGPGQLEMDLTTRRELYTDEERSAAFAALSPEHQRMFQGFADGVNAFIHETRVDPLRLSAEFYAIGHLPEDWVPEDTIAIAQFLLDIFGAGSGGNELENAKLLVLLRDRLGETGAEAAFNDLFPMHDATTYVTIPEDEYVYAATEGQLDFADVPTHQWAVVEAAARATPFAGGKSLVEAAQAAGWPTKFGSNALLVAPELSASGGALLLGGPQMAYYNPMVPYEVALHGAGFDAVGMGVGGAPGVIIGRNTEMAWTVTSGSSDQVDVVAVKLVDGSPREYYVSGASGETAAMDCTTHVHVGPPTAVDPNPPVLAVQETCRTERGPVFAMDEEGGYAFVRERTHRMDELRSGLLWLTLAQNTDLASFQDHMESFRFEFNFFVATDGGDIAYYHFGGQPVRDASCDPRLPRLAGACDWQGLRTGSELPFIVNPEKGYLVNWNNKPAMGWSGGDAMEKWGPVHRAELFEETVQAYLAEGPLSATDLRAINVDIADRGIYPARLAPFILDATEDSADPLVQAARAALADWGDEGWHWQTSDATCLRMTSPDPCFGTYHPGFAVYETWRGLMQEAVFLDEMDAHMRAMGFEPATSSDPHAADHGREDNKDNTLLNALRGEAAHDWCSHVFLDVVITCDELVAQTFDAAVQTLAVRFGTADVPQWRQDAHTIQFAVLSGGPSWRIHMVNRPSFNHYYDFAAGEAGSVMPPGSDQTWRPVDFVGFQMDGSIPGAHKTDQLDLYVAYAFKPAALAPLGGGAPRTFTVTAP